MSLTHYGGNSLERRVKELEQDKQQLSQAIEELNHCYQEKIMLLEHDLAEQKSKNQELLEWRQEHMGNNLVEFERYDKEIKKVIDVLDTLHKQFEREKEELERTVELQKQEIGDLKTEN